MIFLTARRYCACALFAFVCIGLPVFGTPKNITQEELLNLAHDKRRFSPYESPVLNLRRDMLAYCVLRRRTNAIQDFYESGIPGSKIDSQIYVTDLQTKTSIEVGRPDANNWLPSWSPDGSKLSFFSDARGKPELWIYNLKEKKSFPLSSARIRSDIEAFSRSIWSPDGKLIYVQLIPERKNEVEKCQIQDETTSKMVRVYESGKNPRDGVGTDNIDLQKLCSSVFSSDLASINVSSKQVTPIVLSTSELSPSFMKLSPSGNWLCFNSVPLVQEKLIDASNETYDLFISSVNDYNKTQLIEKKIKHRFDQNLPYMWHPKEDKLVYVKEGKLFLIEFDNRGPLPARQLGSESNLITLPFSFSDDGKNIIIGASQDKPGLEVLPRELLYISMDSGSAIKIPIHKDRLFRSVITNNKQCIWEPIANTITFVVTDRATNEDVFVRVSINNNKVVDEHVLWKGSASISWSTSLRNGSLLCLYQDFNTPQDIYRIPDNFDFSLKERITSLDSRLDSLRGMKRETVCTTVTLPDGKTKAVNTTVILPKGCKETDKLPALIIFYPDANSSLLARKFAGGDIIGISNFLFSQAGYVLILPEIPIGAEGVPGDPLQEIVDILLPQMYRVGQQGYIDIDRIGIIGQSYGGYAAAGIIAKTSLFKAAIALGGTYDLPGDYGRLGVDGGYSVRQWAEQGQGRMGTHPWKDLQRFLNNSPYYLANNITTPLLLIHGEKDTACNYIEAEKMFSALQRLGKEARLAIYPGQGHEISEWDRPAAIDAYNRILKFLGDHLNIKPMSHCHANTVNEDRLGE